MIRVARRAAAGRIAVASLLALTLGGCVIPGKATVELSPKAALTGPKVVAIMGTRNDLVAALEDALSPHGFTFRHYRSRERSAELIGAAKMAESLDDNTKYAIEVTPTIFERCLGGGFALTSLTVSVIDRSSNELMFRARATGRTEHCPPASGRIFRDIADAISAAWQR